MANPRIPCTAVLLLVKNVGYHDIMAQYWYHTEAMIQYIQNLWRSRIITMMFAVHCIAVNL
jgi:hypothetical protein